MGDNLYYYEVNVLCLALLVWIMAKTSSNIDKQTKNIIFFRVAFFTAILILIDILWKPVDGHPGKFFFYANNFLNAAYLTISGAVSFNWLIYVLYDFLKSKKLSKLNRFIFHLPLIVLGVCSLSSPWTHLLFHVDPQTNIYYRGPYHFIQEVIAYGYFLVSCILLIYKLIKERNNIAHIKQNAVFSYIFSPLVAGIFSYLFKTLEIIWQAASVSMLVAFYNMQIEQISVDALTGLNNRRTFNSLLRTLPPSNRNGKDTFLYMIDINNFKSINDHFGHPEGDAALKETASLLKTVFGGKDAFICRFGGDEFSAVYYCANAFEADSVRDELYDAFEKRNTKEKKYSLTVSAGYAKLNGEGVEATNTLIKNADVELYKEKQKLHTTLRT